MKLSLAFFLSLLLSCATSLHVSAQEPLFPDKTTGGSEGGLVGAIESEYDVSPNGQFHYEIPIPAIAGTGGMKPNFSIVYDSSTKDGVLGYGFELTGLSVIHRMPSTALSDDVVSAVNFSNSDHFALDGMRLNQIGNENGSNFEYRTETESYAKIISSGDHRNPKAFTVLTKTGIKREYKPLGEVLGAKSDSTLFWLETKATDTSGNYYTVSYSGDSEWNEYYVSRIDYTGNESMGLTPYASLKFSYIDNIYVPVSYIGGKKVRKNKILSGIEVFNQNKLVRKLDFGYNVINNRYFLKRIKEYSTSGDYYNPTLLDWHSIDNFSATAVANTHPAYIRKARITIGDFNGDGKADFLTTPDDKNSGWEGWELFLSNGKDFDPAIKGSFHWPSDEIQQVVAGDFNGDGLCDIVVKRYVSTGSYNCDLYIAESSGSSVTLTYKKRFFSDTNNFSIQTVEVNGDGADDLFIWFHESKRFNIIRSTRKTKQIQPLYNNTLRYCKANFDHVEFGDFNGDGLTDVLNFDNDTSHLLQSDGYGTMSEASCSLWFTKKHHIYTGDFNGDGKTDLLVTGFDDDPNKNGWSNWIISYSKGDGHFDNLYTPRGFKDSENEIIVTDVNGDGYDDVQRIPRTSSESIVYPYVYLNDGCGYFKYNSRGGGIKALDQWRFYTGDFNGDGKIDMICTSDWKNSDWNGYLLYLMPDAPVYLLKSITDGLGNTVDVNYRYMSDNSVCTKGKALSVSVTSFGTSWPVVSAVSTPDGLGGRSITSYTYGRPLFHKGGKGFLCFETVSRKDESTGIISTDTYEVDPTKFAVGLKRSVTRIDNKTLTETELTNSLFFSDTSAGNKNIYAYVPVKRRTITYEYNSGEKTSDSSTSYTYDSFGNVKASVTTSDGLTTKLANEYSNDTERWLLGRLVKASVSKSDGSQSQTKTTAYKYDNVSGLLTEECIEPSDTKHGIRKIYSRDGYGNITESTLQPLDGTPGRISKSDYDSKGRFLTAAVNNLGFRDEYDIDEITGLVKSSTDCNGIVTSYAYDAFGNLTQTASPTSKSITTTGWASGMADAPANAVCFTAEQSTGAPYKIEFHDCLGRTVRCVTQSFDNKKTYIDYVYDKQGRLTKESEPYFAGEPIYWNTNQYDKIGRNISRTDASGNSSTMSYLGLKTVSTDALGCSVTKICDSHGNLATSIDNDGTAVDFTYDVEGRCVKVECGDRVIEIGYDILGNRTMLDDPDLGVSTMEYNAFGELSKKTDQYGVTDYTYDEGGRIILESHDDCSIETTYDTRWKGSVSDISINDISINGNFCGGKMYDYDEYGRIVTETTAIQRTSFSTTFTYNDKNQVEAIAYPSGVKIRNSYDASGVLKSVSDSSSGLVYWQLLGMDSRGQVEKEKYGNGVITTTKHDPKRGLTVGITAQGISDWTYSYDAVGNLTSRKDMTRDLEEGFLYDTMHRLKTIQKNGISVQGMSYDAYGNITFKSNVSFYNYEDASNRLVSIGPCVCEPKVWDEIRYNSRGKVSYIESGGASMRINYGPDGNCMRKTDGEKVRYYVSKLFEESDEARNVINRSFIYAAGKMVAIVVDDPHSGIKTVQYVHHDHLGSIQALSDKSGNLMEEFSYDVWGMRRNPDDWTNYSDVWNHVFGETYGFTGHEHLDMFCMVDMRGRLYDPLIGRFISPDPIIQLADYSQSLNRYVYCLNNPLSLIDPSGYSWFSKNWKSILASIVGIGVSVLTMGSGSGLGIAIIAGAAGGASCALTGALLNGSNFGQIAKNTLIGGIVGAAGAFLNFASADPNIFISIAKHSFSQGWMEGIQGGNAVHGFMVGAVSKAGGAAIDTYSPHVGKIGAMVMNSVLSGVVDELGGGKFANGAITGAFSYLFNETMHRVQDRGDSDDHGSALAEAIPIALAISQVDGPIPLADIFSAALIGVAAAYDLTERIFVTYTLTNNLGMIYIGRASGFGNPFSVMMGRYSGHHMKAFGFHSPTLDRWAQGGKGREAIRGREQQLIDFYGGIDSPFVANRIRGVSKYNPFGRLYHNRSNAFFGNLAPFTGY